MNRSQGKLVDHFSVGDVLVTQLTEAVMPDDDYDEDMELDSTITEGPASTIFVS